ncbi:hypothetical protein CPE01_24690 [Cellulomonas persica]|uniref:HTH cro/C1-type domain-containing protein n=1 Tax=Cellulomonas persica TaxID=76861 RepID=A0A510UW55_9CELL|nr:hypothetical protein CPE01_24690 [Cellulomonas persica]
MHRSTGALRARLEAVAPGLDTVVRIAETFDVTVDYLVLPDTLSRSAYQPPRVGRSLRRASSERAIWSIRTRSQQNLRHPQSQRTSVRHRPVPANPLTFQKDTDVGAARQLDSDLPWRQ